MDALPLSKQETLSMFSPRKWRPGCHTTNRNIPRTQLVKVLEVEESSRQPEKKRRKTVPHRRWIHSRWFTEQLYVSVGVQPITTPASHGHESGQGLDFGEVAVRRGAPTKRRHQTPNQKPHEADSSDSVCFRWSTEEQLWWMYVLVERGIDMIVPQNLSLSVSFVCAAPNMLMPEHPCV